jgi:CelD/BcsL family acetyltransferase involved in cellulose biosynthesis
MSVRAAQVQDQVSGKLGIELLDIRSELPAVEHVWKELLPDSPHSYFLSWSWIEYWISTLPERAGVRLAVFRRDGKPFAAAFLGHATVVRQRLFRSTAYLLNQTGNRTLDQLYIEDNAFLCAKDCRFSWQEILPLLPDRWEEFFLSGIDAQSAFGQLLQEVAPPYRLLVANRIPSPYVDLRSLGGGSRDYLSLLSANTRSQIRRCYRLYEGRGPLQRTVAADVRTALDIYEELVDLHQRAWHGRGQQGAFASDYFYKFHRGLIERRSSSGELQLIRIRSGSETIGCLYNFVYKGTVSFYQSGLRFEEDNRFKPGFICHCEAIRHNAELGHAIYDFMASFDDYKLRMATHQRDLLWVRIQKPNWKFEMERLLRAGALHAAAQYRKAKTGRKRPPRVQTAEPAC